MNFMIIHKDSFKDVVDKYVVDILLADDDIKHIEYSTRGQQSSNLWGEYRKEKLRTSDIYIAVVNKVEPNKIKSSFKTSSVKHGIVNESVALTEYAVNAWTEYVSLLTEYVSLLTEYVSLLRTQSVTVNFVQPGDLFYQSYILFLGHHLTLW